MSVFSDFITEHQEDDTDRLLFSREKWPDIDMNLAVNTILCRRKIRTRLPSWHAVPDLVYPERLSAEQCSSEETAAYKAGLAARLLSGQPCRDRQTVSPDTHAAEVRNGGAGHDRAWRIADLTGGLGVDSHAFSKIAAKVLYNERNNILSEAAKSNFLKLNAQNIIVFNKNISVTPSEAGISPTELLESFSPDLIFLDPARRAADGRKVFLIEDCSPDVLAIKDELMGISRFVMIKLSPMADISMAAERLGPQTREIHVVSSDGECKELLVVMDREWSGEYTVTAVENIPCGETFTFTRREEAEAAGSLQPLSSGQHFCELHQEECAPECNSGPARSSLYLFEPGKSMLKAGAFNLPCERFGLKKFGRSTHLYVTGDAGTATSLLNFGKIFAIRQIIPFNNRNIKEVGALYPDADVTARNLPITSDELKKKISGQKKRNVRNHVFPSPDEAGSNVKPHHIFAVKSDMEGNLLIVTIPYRPHQF